MCKRIRLTSGKGKLFLPATSTWRDLTSPPITSVTRHRWSPSRSFPGCMKLASSRGQWFGSMPEGGGMEATRSRASSSHVIPRVARSVEYPFKALMATYLSSLRRSYEYNMCTTSHVKRTSHQTPSICWSSFPTRASERLCSAYLVQLHHQIRPE